MATTIDRQWVARHLLLLEAPIPDAVSRALGRLLADTVAIAAYARRHQVGGTRIDSARAQPLAAGSGSLPDNIRHITANINSTL